MIKLITFDLWNTVFSGRDESNLKEYRKNKLYNYFKNKGIEISPDLIEYAIAKTWEYFRIKWLGESYTPHPLELTKVVLDNLKVDYDEDEIKKVCDLLASSILERKPPLVDGVKDVIEKLTEKYILAVVSDTGISGNKYLKELLDYYGILQYFSYFSFSDELGVSKPHEKMFTNVLDKANVSPNNALHVGDLAQTDVHGAKKIGMFAVQFIGDERREISQEADAVIESMYDLIEVVENINNQTRKVV